MNASNRREIPSLDGLRAVSILLVVLAHAVGLRRHGLLGRIESRLDVGVLGVRVFFVISGFLITSLLLREERRTATISLPRFYFRRCARIFPAFYVYLAVVAAAGLLGLVSTPGDHLGMSFAYLSNYLPHADWYVGHSWSLSIEEQFYLLWPLLLVLVGRRISMGVAAGYLACAPIARLAVFTFLPTMRDGLDRWFPLVADALAAGCLLAGLGQRLSAWQAYLRFRSSLWFLFVPVSVGLADAMLVHPRLYYGLGVTVMNVGIALCIDWCIARHDGWIGKLLNAPPVRYVGVMSYSIYLWQQPFLSHRADALGALPIWARVVGVFAAPILSYYLVEKTFLVLRDRLEPLFFAPSPRDVPANPS